MRWSSFLPVALLTLSAACADSPPLAADTEIAAARDLATCGKLDEARAALAQLDVAHPTDARVALLAAEVATWRGFPEDALEWLRRASRRNPASAEPHLRTAYVLLVHPPDGEPEVDAALVQAESALTALGGAESAGYRACRGEAAWAAGDVDAAERWFRGALELHPDCRRALHRLLQITAARGDEESAELQERLGTLIDAGRTGHGMENARVPASFCGD